MAFKNPVRCRGLVRICFLLNGSRRWTPHVLNLVENAILYGVMDLHLNLVFSQRIFKFHVKDQRCQIRNCNFGSFDYGILNLVTKYLHLTRYQIVSSPNSIFKVIQLNNMDCLQGHLYRIFIIVSRFLLSYVQHLKAKLGIFYHCFEWCGYLVILFISMNIVRRYWKYLLGFPFF